MLLPATGVDLFVCRFRIVVGTKAKCERLLTGKRGLDVNGKTGQTRGRGRGQNMTKYDRRRQERATEGKVRGVMERRGKRRRGPDIDRGKRGQKMTGQSERKQKGETKTLLWTACGHLWATVDVLKTFCGLAVLAVGMEGEGEVGSDSWVAG